MVDISSTVAIPPTAAGCNALVSVPAPTTLNVIVLVAVGTSELSASCIPAVISTVSAPSATIVAALAVLSIFVAKGGSPPSVSTFTVPCKGTDKDR